MKDRPKCSMSAVGCGGRGGHRSRAEGGAAGRSGGAVARRARGQRWWLLRYFVLVLAHLRDRPACQYRREPAGIYATLTGTRG